MWFATPDGLNRFNGYDFTVYRHQYGDSTSIACNATRCVTVDGAGRVWIGTGEGLSLYDDEKECFSNFYLNCNGRNVAVVNIVQMRKGKLLLATTEGLVVFDMDTHRFLEDALPVSVSLLKMQQWPGWEGKYILALHKACMSIRMIQKRLANWPHGEET